MAANTHTIELQSTGGADGSPVEMPLRVHIREVASGKRFTIQAAPGGIIISVDEGLIIKPGASNSVMVSSTNY